MFDYSPIARQAAKRTAAGSSVRSAFLATLVALVLVSLGGMVAMPTSTVAQSLLTAIPTLTVTVLPTAPLTSTATQTPVPTAAPTATASPTATQTPTQVAQSTATVTTTPPPSLIPNATATASPTSVPAVTNTPAPTPAAAPTATSEPTYTPTATFTTAPFTTPLYFPVLTLSPTQGPAGVAIAASGSQFKPGEDVLVRFGLVQIGVTTASAAGEIALTFPAPNLGPWQYPVTGTGQTSQGMAITEFTIVGGDLPLTVAPPSGPVGTSATAVGQGFSQGEQVDVLFNGASVGTTPADASGYLTITFTVPSLPLGSYKVTAQGQMSGISASGFFEITGVNAASAPVPGVPTVAPAEAPLSPEPAPPVAHDERYFAATGFRVENDAIWNYFQARGQVSTFGYPISRSLNLLGCVVQMFQRQLARLCSGGDVNLMNILDPDVFPYTQVNGSVFPGPDAAIKASTPPVSSPTYASDIINFVQSSAPDSFDGQPVNFSATFFNSVGADQAGTDDPNILSLLDLEIWGAPISQPMADPSNPAFVYQRFQRGIMHFTAGAGTQGILLSDYLKAILMNRDLPADLRVQAHTSRFFAQYCPSAPQWLCRPSELPGSDFTNAFDPG